MIIILKQNYDQNDANSLIANIQSKGIEVQQNIGTSQTVLGLIGDTTVLSMDSIKKNASVEDVIKIQESYKKANRKFHPDDSVIDVAGVKIGGKHFGMISGTCSVEDIDTMLETAAAVKAAGGNILRGGAYKPRTSPYSFQGQGVDGLKILREAGDSAGLPICSELMDASNIDEFVEYVDMIQIGARNAQNFTLLKEVGKTNLPVLLKRGMSQTIEEWLMSAEYIMAEGNDNVILCERGIRSFDSKYTRNVLDLQAIPVVQRLSHLPIVIDPSHAAGTRYIIPATSKAAVAAGANGLTIEIHPRPEEAWSDGQQSLDFNEFNGLMDDVKRYIDFEGKVFG